MNINRNFLSIILKFKVLKMANEDSIGKALTKVIIYSVIFVVAMGIV